MLRRVALVRTDVSEERGAFIIRTRIGDLGTTLVVTNKRSTLRSRIVFLRSLLRLLVAANIVPIHILVILMMKALRSSETAVVTRATWRYIPEDNSICGF
jgi:hypothetical protein